MDAELLSLSPQRKIGGTSGGADAPFIPNDIASTPNYGIIIRYSKMVLYSKVPYEDVGLLLLSFLEHLFGNKLWKVHLKTMNSDL